MTAVTIPNTVTTFEQDAFIYCTGLTTVDIPNSVITIGRGAFYQCTGLTDVTIGNSVTLIDRDAFSGCTGLISIDIPNSVDTIGQEAFYGCSSLTSAIIGNSVTFIDRDAFIYCSGLTSIDIPNSVITIGRGAFYQCTGLTDVTIGNSVTLIDRDAFKGCTNLTSIDIPNSVITIGRGAFHQCSGLTDVTIGNSVTLIDRDAFSECASLDSIVIPNSVQTIGSYAFYRCSSLTSAIIGDSVTLIDINAFRNCSNLRTVEFGESLITIGESAFDRCTSLQSVILPNSVTTVGNNAFWGCWSNGTLVLGDSLTTIGNGSFYNHSAVMTIIIPNSVESIGVNAFKDCFSLRILVIGENVDTIMESAFEDSRSLDTVYSLSPIPPTLGPNVFKDCRAEKILVVPCGSEEAYRNSAWGQWFPNIIVSPPEQMEIFDTICQGSDYVANDFNLTNVQQSGVHIDTLRSFTGCDSVITTLNLTVNPTYQHTDTVTICDNALPYSYGDSTFLAAGQYAVTFSSMNGCDSVMNLALLVNNTYQHTDTVTICDNALPYSYGDSTFAAAGQYTVTFFSMNGCDSIVNLALLVNNTYQHADTVTICDNALPYNYGDSTFAAAGQYAVTFSSMNGCDSVMNLALIVNPTYQHTDTATICDNALPYSYGDSTFAAAGQYAVTFSSINGCDSIVNLALIVNPTYQHTDTVTICSNALPYSYGDSTFSAAGQYTVTFSSINGCDSVMNLALLVNNTYQYADTVTVCDNALPYSYGDSTFSTAGQYTVAFLSRSSCDSIVTLTLTVNPTLDTNISAVVCQGSDYTDNGFHITNVQEDGTHTLNLQTISGCDSTVNLQLNLVDQSLLARIDVSPDYATLTRTEITFRDISLNGTRRIWLMPDGSRRYDAVVHYTFPLDYDSITTRLIAIDSWGCQDSAEVTIPLRKECIWIPNAFTPGLATNNRFMVKGTGILSFHIEIYDRNGSLVARWDGLDGSWDGTDLHGHPCPNGSYMYLAKYSHVVSPRAVQHKRGTITLLR